MKTLKFKQVLTVAVSLLTYSLLTTYCRAEITGASFLNVDIGARSAGLGNAFTAIGNDVTAINSNPGGLAGLEQREFSAMFSQWIVDSNVNFVGFAQPTKNGTFGTSIVYLSQGNLEGRGINGEKTADFGANDLAVSASYSRELNNRLNLGVNVKFIQEQIESEQANGVALDVGSIYQLNKTISLGFSVQNIGPEMKFMSGWYNIPLTLNAGLGFYTGRVTVGLDLKQQVYDGRKIICLGTEFSPFKTLSLRAGCSGASASQVTTTEDTGLGFGGGIGLNIFGTNIDYAFMPYGVLGNTQRISFSAKF